MASFPFAILAACFFLTLAFGNEAEISSRSTPPKSTEPSKSESDPKLACLRYFKENNCQSVIDEAGPASRKNFLDCNSGDFSSIKTCAGSAAAGLAISAVIPPAVAQTLGKASLPLLVIGGGAVALNWLTNTERACYNNTPYKKALLEPWAAYFGDAYEDPDDGNAADAIMHLSCIALESKVRAFKKRVDAEIYQKQMLQQSFAQELQKRPGDQRFKSKLERSIKYRNKEFTEAETRYLNTLDRLSKEQLELLRRTQEIIKKTPCRSWDYYAGIACGLAGGLALGPSKALMARARGPSLPKGSAQATGAGPTKKIEDQFSRAIEDIPYDLRAKRHMQRTDYSSSHVDSAMRSLPVQPTNPSQVVQPRVSIETLKQQLAANPSKNTVSVSVGKGGEAEVFAVISKQKGKYDIKTVKAFDWKESPHDHIEVLTGMAKFQKNGELGPFSVIGIRGVEGRKLMLDYVEGRSLRDIILDDSFRKTPEGQKIIQGYMDGILSVARRFHAKGYNVEVRDGYPLPYLNVDKKNGDHLFTIADDLLIDANTGQMIVIDAY